MDIGRIIWLTIAILLGNQINITNITNKLFLEYIEDFTAANIGKDVGNVEADILHSNSGGHSLNYLVLVIVLNFNIL
jgi:hypothetical protein